MFYFKNKEQLAESIKRLEKARNNGHKSHIKMIEFGHYLVRSLSDRNRWYDVTCFKLRDGRKKVECGCQGSIKPGNICVHSVIAINLHVEVAKVRCKNS